MFVWMTVEASDGCRHVVRRVVVRSKYRSANLTYREKMIFSKTNEPAFQTVRKHAKLKQKLFIF